MDPLFAKVFLTSNNAWRSLVHRIRGDFVVSPNGKFSIFIYSYNVFLNMSLTQLQTTKKGLEQKVRYLGYPQLIFHPKKILLLKKNQQQSKEMLANESKMVHLSKDFDIHCVQYLVLCMWEIVSADSPWRSTFPLALRRRSSKYMLVLEEHISRRCSTFGQKCNLQWNISSNLN